MFLVYALWAIALLSTIALSVLSVGNAAHHVVRNATEAAEVDAAAEAAVARAVLALIDPRPEQRWRVDGVPQNFSYGAIAMRVSLQDEFGRIDLNHADHGLLVGLLQSAGLEFTDADGLTARILDWRDPGPGRRTGGAAAADYRSAGLAYTPRGGPFQSVDEVRLVMGMSAALYLRIRPALTVYSARPLFDPQFAPREALSALSSVNADALASILAARATHGTNNGVMDPSIARRGRAFAIRIEFQKPAGPAAREVLVRLTEDNIQPYWVLSSRAK